MIDPNFPLIDLHRHLDGNVRLETILDLGRRHNLPLPVWDVEGLRPHVQVTTPQPGVMAFIAKFKWMMAVLVDYDACRRVAYENVEDAQREGIDYVELRFSPWFMAESHGLDPAGVVEAVADGVEAGARDFGVKVNLIGILSRTYGPDVAWKELEALLQHRDRLVALDLAGDEANWPGNLFVEHMQRAREAGWQVTIHAGEVAGPESVWQAIRELGAKRIGHAVRAIEDPLLLDYLAEHQIGIESCLTSNVQTSVVPDYASHPLRTFLERGLLAAINTDDPGVSGIDLRHEYEVAAPAAGLTAEQTHQAQRNALAIAFLSAEERDALRCNALSKYVAPQPQKITHVVKRTGAVVPFKKERITNAIYRAAVAVGGRDRSIAERLADQVVAMLEETMPPGHIPTVEEIQDIVEKVLIERGHAKTAKAYILYRDERARRRKERAARSAQPSENIPWRKIWEVLNWAVDHDLHTVERLNARIARGEFRDIVRETDRAYNEDVTTASEMIKERQGNIRLVIIAGPSSSGKTTTTIKLSHLLRKMRLSLVPLTVDNYFFDLELHPKDEFGDYDFETPQALDLELINEHLVRLLAGEEVWIPFYDFKTGKRHDNHTPMRVGPNDIILIDSLHGLYPDMTKGVDDKLKFKLYIEPLLQMKDPDGKFVRWTDLRMMRRVVRDAAFRAYDPQQTLEHWHYVRKSEMRNIIPHINTADYIVNSGLPYELPIMRARLFHHFERWVDQYRDDPLRVDAFMRAERVYNLLKSVTPVEDESAIPPDSLLREFIGGSCYEYS